MSALVYVRVQNLMTAFRLEVRRTLRISIWPQMIWRWTMDLGYWSAEKDFDCGDSFLENKIWWKKDAHRYM